jgi:hypothetical protein
MFGGNSKRCPKEESLAYLMLGIGRASVEILSRYPKGRPLAPLLSAICVAIAAIE